MSTLDRAVEVKKEILELLSAARNITNVSIDGHGDCYRVKIKVRDKKVLDLLLENQLMDFDYEGVPIVYQYDESEDIYIPCLRCSGTGQVPCRCDEGRLKTVKDHPLNQVDFSGQGYYIAECADCHKVWGVRYQYDPGTGSDHRYHCFGVGDPMLVAKERHY